MTGEQAGRRARISRRGLVLGVVAGLLTAACDSVWPAATPTPTSPALGSPSPAAGAAQPGQPIATRVEIVTSPSPVAAPVGTPPVPARLAVQPGLPLIVPGRLASPSPGVAGSPGTHAAGRPGTGISPSPSPSPPVFPIVLGRPGLLAVVASGRILLVDPERQQPVRTLVDSPDCGQPRWSPDGRSVLYIGGLGPAAELRLLPAQGGAPRRLTANARPERGTVWSPGGNHLTYTLPSALGPDGQPDPAAPDEVWLLDVGSGDASKLADGFDPCWSPDGRWIAYATNGQRNERGPRENAIRVVSADGRDDRPLLAVSHLPSDLLPSFGVPFRPGTLRLRAPAWSPTGLHLVASADGHTSLAWTFDVHGQQFRPWALAYEGGVGRARWSPDGARLAIESLPATGVATVTLVEVATGRETTLGGPGAGFQALTPSWSPDGRRLALVAASLPARHGEPRQTALRLFDAGGADLGELLTEPGLQDPDWSQTP